MNKNIFLGVALAPYRLDFYNYLSKHFNCNMYFQLRYFEGQLFSTDQLIKKCSYTPYFLEIRTIGHRNIIKHIGEIIKSNNPNTVFVPEFSLIAIQIILYRFLSKKKFKIVSICDDSYDILMGNGFSKAHHYARKILMPFIDDIILVDKKVVDWYQNEYKKGIWMPIIRDENIMLPYLNTLNAQANKIRKAYSGKKILLFVGRLVDVKNIPLLLKAYKNLSSEYELIIIGDGEIREKLQQLCKSLGICVHFLGKKEGDDLYVWYKAADTLVLPSYREPFGAVVNEALLAGCKCVVSKNAGASCLINEGINGYTFDPTSIDDLVRCIRTSIQMSGSGSKMLVSFTTYMNNLIEILNLSQKN